MATLVADSLGLGTGKQEGDVSADLFAAFGVDLAALEADLPQHTPDRAAKLRAVAAKALSRNAPNTGSIVAELVRTNSLLVAMIEQIYRLLCDCEATTTGTSEQFRILPSDVDGVELTLSPAFFTQVTHLLRKTVAATLNTLDSKALETFVGLDMGIPYGQWPLPRSESIWSPIGVTQAEAQYPLAAAVLQVGEAVHRLGERAVVDPSWVQPARAAGEALEAAEQLVQEAERVVNGFTSWIDHLANTAPIGVPAGTYVAEHAYGVSPDSHDEGITGEIERYLRDSFLGAQALFPASGSERVAHEVGMCKGEPIVNIVNGEWYPSSAVAALAAWCSMFREGLDPGLPSHKWTTPTEWTAWLERLSTACTEATIWMRKTLVLLQEEITGERVYEEVKQLLDLPLWQHRDLLYEVWLLCTTLRACEQAGWTMTLTGLDPDTRAWVLPGSQAAEPVAYLTRQLGGERLEVWREPLRTFGDDRKLTPDVTISVPGEHPRDLVVVEAKDRIKMSEGSALGYARRYADALSPRLTWLCNHCDLRPRKTGRSSSTCAYERAEQNHGDPWHAIHMAGMFRPGSVPAVFAETIAAAIRPLNAADAAQPSSADPCSHVVSDVPLADCGRLTRDAASSSLNQPAATRSVGGYLRRAFSSRIPSAASKRPKVE
ncbi:hypothetical protein [Serinicoccus chungangensis]|uniref:hypothetical protein n=1 Tax=Serinicoccus chungangensis TaxID=767452 RepID=UPI00128EFC15|nr:hypothetical protein [Serinicoccus chungangensis]